MTRSSLPPRLRPACVAIVALGLFGACALRSGPQPEALRVIATPQPTGWATVTVEIPDPTPTPPPTAAPVVAPEGGVPSEAELLPAPAPPPPPPPPPPASGGVEVFRGLGAWMDVFDHNDDPASILPAVEDMAAQGVRTLYLETSRAPSPNDIDFPNAVGAALDKAKAHGMYVVAWYPPGFEDMDRDVRRTMAAINFVSPDGNRFDAFGADIEVTARVGDPAERSRGAVEYTQHVRAATGPDYPLAAIVIPPTHLERNPNRWPDFPWAELSPHYQVFMPMNYWTGLGRDEGTARAQTERNLAETQRLSGRPVHIIGGLANAMDVPQTAAYVDASRAGGSIGGSLYDYRITPAELWPELRRLNE